MKLHEYLKQFEGLDPNMEVYLNDPPAEGWESETDYPQAHNRDGMDLYTQTVIANNEYRPVNPDPKSWESDLWYSIVYTDKLVKCSLHDSINWNDKCEGKFTIPIILVG